MAESTGLRSVTYRIPPGLDERLGEVARRTGRSKSYYLRRALAEWLEDREDYLEAVAVLERVQRGEEPTVPLEEVLKEAGLDDLED